MQNKITNIKKKIMWPTISITKFYLDSKGIIQKHFCENMPGADWLQSFIKRHPLTKYFVVNVKASRVEVNHEMMNNYFDNLQKWFEGIALNNNFNCDKTNVTDNPGSKNHDGLLREK